MKKTLLFSILFLFISYAQANEASHRAAAEELLKFTKPNQILDQMWTQINKMVDQQYKQMRAPKESRPIFEKYQRKMFEEMKSELSYKNMKEDYITIYTNTYSEKELRDIIAFYKTPTGKVFLEKMPKLIQESMAITQKKLPRLMQRLKQIDEEMIAELKRKKK